MKVLILAKMDFLSVIPNWLIFAVPLDLSVQVETVCDLAELVQSVAGSWGR
jgi:hypothetical protein